MIRIALITNVMAHYRVPCFSMLAHTIEDRIDFFFLAREMSHRSYVMSHAETSFTKTWLKGWSWHRPPADDRHLNDIRPVVSGKYDLIVVGGWDEPTYLLLWMLQLVRRKKILFWIESTAYDGNRKGLKEFFKRLLLRHAAGCIVPGKRSFEYCSQLGVPEDRKFIAPNATDREFFRSRADQFIPMRQEIKTGMGVEGIVILFVGRLVEDHKNVSVLIKAFSRLIRSGHKVSLFIVGDGPDRSYYESLVSEGGTPGVHFLGELNHDQLCRVYAASDIQVLQSKWEPWGFVLNEGMEFGLPLVVSDAVGAGPDLVHIGENGFVFRVGDTGALANYLELLLNDEALRQRMGQASREIIEHFSPENWSAGFLQAIKEVSGNAHD